MAASTLHGTDEVDKRAVHKLMTHRASTAEKYYMIDNLNEAAERGAMVLRKNLGIGDTIATPSVEKAQGLTQSQKEDIDLLFADIIQTNGPLSIRTTRSVMSESINLLEFASDPDVIKKVYDRVNYLKKKADPERLSNLPEQDLTENTREWLDEHHTSATQKSATPSSYTSATGSRRRWHPADTQAIEEAFKTFDLCPKIKIIEDTFESSEELQEIMDRNGFHRCYEKAKNVFKARK